MTDILSPIMLWKDFDPCATPLEISVIKEWNSDGVVFRELYFTGAVTEDGKIRAYGIYAYPKGGDNLPAVVLLDDETSVDLTRITEYAKMGYAVFSLDYCGNAQNAGRYTLYPPSLSYANFCEARDSLFGMNGDVRNNCWLVYTKLARRAITLLSEFEEVDSQSMGFLGVGLGGDMAFKIAATDARIKAAAAIFCKNWLGRKSPFLYDENTTINDQAAQWITLISAQSYCQHIKIPFYILANTNERTGSFDNLYNCYLRLPLLNGQFISVTERQHKVIGYKQRNNLSYFFDTVLKNSGEFLQRPDLVVSGEDENLTFTLTADPKCEVESAEIFYSYSSYEAAARNWYSLKLNKDQNIYTATAPIAAIDRQFLAFASIKYKDNMSLSSRLIVRTPRQLKLLSPTMRASRLVYDDDMGKDCFCVINSNKQTFDKEPISVVKGALDIYGVLAEFGDLATYKMGDSYFSCGEDSNLIINLFTEKGGTATFKFYEFKNGNLIHSYSAQRELPSSEGWQKICLERTEFKTADGAIFLQWSDVAMFSISCQNPVAVCSILWA